MKKKSDYWERQTWYPYSMMNHLCKTCKTIFKQGKFSTWSEKACRCPVCNEKLIWLGIATEVPRKRASNRIWRKFFKENFIGV